eukprot:6932234-Prorocentrum_lima.AAC.1
MPCQHLLSSAAFYFSRLEQLLPPVFEKELTMDACKNDMHKLLHRRQASPLHAVCRCHTQCS